MAVNRYVYGFRPWKPLTNLASHDHKVVTAYQATVTTDVDFGVGDVVQWVSDGTVSLAVGSEGTQDDIYGVITNVVQYYDSTNDELRRGEVIPGGTTYTLHARASVVSIVPASSIWWEVMVDDKTSATTRAAYELLIGTNADHVNVALNTRANPQIDVSTANTTETLQWRIMGVSPTEENRDFAEENVKLLVMGNRVNEPAAPATRIVGV